MSTGHTITIWNNSQTRVTNLRTLVYANSEMQYLFLPNFLKCVPLKSSNFFTFTFICTFRGTRVKKRETILIIFRHWWSCYKYLWIYKFLEKMITFVWLAENSNKFFGRNEKKQIQLEKINFAGIFGYIH